MSPSDHPGDAALVEEAREAALRAYAPYSGFCVGAIVCARSGVRYRGCNVENVTNALTLCAERVAIQAALSEGEEIATIGIAAPDGHDANPCGICRQLLRERAPDARVVLSLASGGFRVVGVESLLPARGGDPGGRS